VRVNPFTQAKPYLWNGEGREGKQGKERYLCHALALARGDRQIDVADYSVAGNMIRARLGEHTFVESWLACEAYIRVSELTPENVQAYRLRWLEDLEQLWNQGGRK
jgi:hypothetical protein